MVTIVRHTDKCIIEPARNGQQGRQAGQTGSGIASSERRETPQAGRPELAPEGNEQGLGRGWAEAAGGQ